MKTKASFLQFQTHAMALALKNTRQSKCRPWLLCCHYRNKRI